MKFIGFSSELHISKSCRWEVCHDISLSRGNNKLFELIMQYRYFILWACTNLWSWQSMRMNFNVFAQNHQIFSFSRISFAVILNYILRLDLAHIQSIQIPSGHTTSLQRWNFVEKSWHVENVIPTSFWRRFENVGSTLATERWNNVDTIFDDSTWNFDVVSTSV